MQNKTEKIGFFYKFSPKSFGSSGPVILGSSPSTPTEIVAKMLKRRLAIFLFPKFPKMSGLCVKPQVLLTVPLPGPA